MHRRARLGHHARMTGLDRAKDDVARGEVRKARDRLKGLVGTYPRDVELRAMLANAYRLDRQFPEAGRWGYLIGPHASQKERTAFERHAFAGYARVSEARLARLLRAEDLAAITDEAGRALLRALPARRVSPRRDRPLERVSRAIAVYRARRRWR